MSIMIYNISCNPQLQNLMLFHNYSLNLMFAFLSDLHLCAFIFNFHHNVLQDCIPQTFHCRSPLMLLHMLCISSSCYAAGYSRCVWLFCFVTVILISTMVGILKLIVELHCFGGKLFPTLCNIKIIHIVIYCYHYMAMTLAVLHHAECLLFHFDFSWTYLSN